MSDDNDNQKRKPGRPRKVPNRDNLKHEGLVTAPSDPKNLIEITYDKPSNFKKICGFWKSLNADKINFVFTAGKLTLYNKNFKNTNDIGITCQGSKMTRFYCGKSHSISVGFSNLEPILSKLDATYESISFIVQEKTQNKTLHIILDNMDEIPEFFEVDMVIDDKFNYEAYAALFMDEALPDLDFKLSGRYFKKMISDTKQFDKQITFEKFGQDGNFTMCYKTVNGQVKARIVPRNPKALSINSNIGKAEIFSVSVFIDNIRPTSTNHLANTVHIKAFRNKPLWITAKLEDAITVDVLINIIDHRDTPVAK